MITVGIEALKGCVGIITDILKDPETYEKIEGVRKLLCELTGKEIDQNKLVLLLEETTQGKTYDGTWEENDNEYAWPRRFRADGGWIYEVSEGTNPIFVPDK